jgi:transposase InsO family protein
VAAEVEDQIVALRKDLAGQGLDAGPHTIAWHLAGRGDPVPSVATIWRVLRRRGLITPQPQKRPRSSCTRFCADLPNERWQMDITHWQLAGGASAEILNIIDDHSRFLIASAARRAYRAADVVTVFRHAADQHGPPASMLADNGAVFTAAPRHGACVIEGELIAAGITYSHSRPYHPQTCGKVERFHQTLKKWLTRQRPVSTIGALQAQLDRFAAYCNTCRPHRAIGRQTPATAYAARIKALPAGPQIPVPAHCRVRQDAIDSGGSVTLRYRSKLYHIGVGRRHAGTKVIILAADLNVRILTPGGTLLRELTLDPARNYQPQRLPARR